MADYMRLDKAPLARGPVADGPDEAAAHRIRRTAVVLLIVILFAATAGFFAVFRFAAQNEARDLEIWRERLAVIASSRAAAADEWIGAQRDLIRGIAGNPTLQMYLTELAWAADDTQVTDGAARRDIIRTYLSFSAQQGRFHAGGGLALFDRSGRPVWAEGDGEVLTDLASRHGNLTQPLILGPLPDRTGRATMAFLVPVSPIGGVGGAPVGVVVGVRPVKDLVARIVHPGDQAGVSESLLVRRRDGGIDYLPSLDEDAGSVQRMAWDAQSALAFALSNPAAFGQRRDLRGQPVLVSGEALSNLPWMLVRLQRSDDALAEIRARRNAILAVFSLIIVCLTAGLLLLWRHGVSLRVAAAAHKLKRLNIFLQRLIDGQPTAIMVFDDKGRPVLANARAQAAGDLAPQALLEAGTRRALAEAAPQSGVHNVAGRVLKVDHVPVRLPDPDGGGAGVLVVVEDLSALVAERERRENTLRQLVSTIAGILDSRDPFAARHSRWVAELSEAIAQEMGLSDLEVETAEVAGALMNLGKVMVPRRLLTNRKNLSPDELDWIRASIAKSADLLRQVEFNGPVVATIRQVQAHWDGTGRPAGLAGEDILLTARIVAVANAFVAMISARAHRAPLPLEQVIELLLERVGRIYDRRVVAALLAYLDGRGGRALWLKRAQDSGVNAPA